MNSTLMVQNKIAMARLGFELCASTTIPDWADVPGDERGTNETSPKPLRWREVHRAAIIGLEGYYRKHNGKSKGVSEEQARPRQHPFGERRSTGQVLMGSRIITVSIRGSRMGVTEEQARPLTYP